MSGKEVEQEERRLVVVGICGRSFFFSVNFACYCNKEKGFRIFRMGLDELFFFLVVKSFEYVKQEMNIKKGFLVVCLFGEGFIKGLEFVLFVVFQVCIVFRLFWVIIFFSRKVVFVLDILLIFKYCQVIVFCKGKYMNLDFDRFGFEVRFWYVGVL